MSRARPLLLLALSVFAAALVWEAFAFLSSSYVWIRYRTLSVRSRPSLSSAVVHRAGADQMFPVTGREVTADGIRWLEIVYPETDERLWVGLESSERKGVVYSRLVLPFHGIDYRIRYGKLLTVDTFGAGLSFVPLRKDTTTHLLVSLGLTLMLWATGRLAWPSVRGRPLALAAAAAVGLLGIAGELIDNRYGTGLPQPGDLLANLAGIGVALLLLAVGRRLAGRGGRASAPR